VASASLSRASVLKKMHSDNNDKALAAPALVLAWLSVPQGERGLEYNVYKL
jgi:hypothetical protein